MGKEREQSKQVGQRHKEESESYVLHVEVLIPQSLPGTLTYGVLAAEHARVQLGVRVVVPLRRTMRVGVIVSIGQVRRYPFRIMPIEAVLDATPVITQSQMELIRWMSAYYCCRPGLVLSLLMPAALRLDEHHLVEITPKGEAWLRERSQKEFLPSTEEYEVQTTLIRVLQKGSIRLDQLRKSNQDQRKGKEFLKWIASLEEKGLLTVETRLLSVRGITAPYVYLAPPYNESIERLQEAYALLEGTQEERLLLLFQSMLHEKGGDLCSGFSQKLLFLRAELKDTAPFLALLKKGIFEERQETIDTLRGGGMREGILLKELSREQQHALQSIRTQFAQGKSVVLLHGVTGSGKTEVYFHLIAEVLTRGQQVLYLLPEIALTVQMVTRLQSAFGSRVGVYHSRVTAKERMALYRGLLAQNEGDTEQGVDVVVGARSSVFLPFSRLGLIIIDEEHDWSYKQDMPPPLYNGKNVALMMGQKMGAPVLLGSATPTVESYYLAQRSLYGFVPLLERWGRAVLPEVEILDMRGVYRRALAKGHFHIDMLRAIEESVEQGNQVILFQNRRGFSPYVECEDCGWIAFCPNCDVRLTYHRSDGQLHCHHCQHQELAYKQCPECGSVALSLKGLGTQRVEKELLEAYPTLRVRRLDMDTARIAGNTAQLLEDFSNGLIDVLIGTQMVTKGLDFSHVTLVGMLNADVMLSMPHFRAWERAFTLMAQAGGRAGRSRYPGRVIIQTRNPANPVFKWVRDHDYQAFYDYTIREREEHQYPPFVRLIVVTLRDSKVERLEVGAKKYANYLHQKLGERVQGPYLPEIAWERNKHLREVQVKCSRGESVRPIKEILNEALILLEKEQALRPIEVIVDVDPW